MENAHSQTTLTSSEYKTFFSNGITFETYHQNMIEEVESKRESEYSQYVPMNLQRSKRILKTFQLQDSMKETLKNLNHKINWLVISEHWCGDASQIMPVIHSIAEASEGKINLKLVYRDSTDLINHHLTNGGKSIPKIVQLDEEFNFLQEWGPRPVLAQELIEELKANGTELPVVIEKIHKWYADDKTVSTQKEIEELLKVIDCF
jgi:hypothetical protein